MVDKWIFRIFMSFVCLHNVNYAQAQTSEFEKFVTQTMLERNVAGVSIARIESGEIVEQFALAHPDTNAQAMTTNTVFQVGSISKPVAAWVVMTLVRDGKIELNAPISRYVSRWRIPPSDFDPEEVTVKRLLSHTAGLSLYGYPGFDEGLTLPALEASLSGNTNGAGAVEQILTPGEQFRYSGGGYTLLQLMVEEVSGIPFSQYAERVVMSPLGMDNSSYAPNDTLLANRATPYVQLKPIEYFQFRAEAAASLHSTAGDLAKFVVANIKTNPVLGEQLKAQMQNGVIDIGPNKVGLGFFLEPQANLIGHNGANQGWRADLLFNPISRSGLVVLTNSNNADFFLQQVRCYWDERFSDAALIERCQSNVNAHKKQLRILSWVTWALFAASSVLILLRIYTVMSSKTTVGFPSRKRRWVFIVLLGILICVANVLLGTSLGVLVISGFTTSLTAMDYAPEGLSQVWLAAQILLFCLMLFCFARKLE
ncbi:MAG: CubicO group peptidase (beta-lactamase class C family) [Alphaproteobacteria bacterium]|jgi:CubicO group peptidase (beta-lactamase class C family)